VRVPDCRVDPAGGELRRLSRHPFVLGHQSVGAALLAAVRQELGPASSVVTEWKPGDPVRPGLLHFRVGRNTDPVSKIEAFERALASWPAGLPGAAGFKFCFVDFDRDTDVEGLFARYRDAVRRVERDHPGLVVYHVTVPLAVDDSLPRRLAKDLLGRPTSRALNRRREEFSDFLRREWGRQGLVFDLAALEAGEDLPPGGTGAAGDGRRALVAGWTEDGAHPSRAAARYLGCRLVRFLAGPVARALPGETGEEP